MSDKSWAEDLKSKIKGHIDDAVDASNTALASNTGKKGDPEISDGGDVQGGEHRSHPFRS